jgi:hypothetical protein
MQYHYNVPRVASILVSKATTDDWDNRCPTMEGINVGKTELTLPAMVNMTIESINVGKTELERLGFTVDKDVNGMPASRNSPSTPKPSDFKALSGIGTTGIRKQISATLSSRQLMRQMSGLGMEDPIFKTTEAELNLLILLIYLTT